MSTQKKLPDPVAFCNFLQIIAMPAEKKYKSFWSFYHYYLAEHSDDTNRQLPFIGAGLIIVFLIAGLFFETGGS